MTVVVTTLEVLGAFAALVIAITVFASALRVAEDARRAAGALEHIATYLDARAEREQEEHRTRQAIAHATAERARYSGPRPVDPPVRESDR